MTRKWIDLANLEVVDGHCHPFLPEIKTEEFAQYLTLSSLKISSHHMANTFLYRRIMNELSKVLECKKDLSEITRIRNQLYRTNPRDYIKMLFENARINTLILDTGYPCEEFEGYSVDLAKFRSFMPCGLKIVHRIDNMVIQLLAKSFHFNQFIEEFIKALEGPVKKHRAVGFKSAIAYITGLDIREVDQDEAQRAYEQIIAKTKANKRKIVDFLTSGSNMAKKLLDFLVLVGMKISVRLGVPFQMHTGFGEIPDLDLRKSNPILLSKILSDEELQNAKIIMVHSGYPFVEEVGFMAHTYPNVYVDLSEMVPFISVGIQDKLLKLFEMAPITKILYGSDGFNIPELFWISALDIKRTLSMVLSRLLSTEIIDEDYAYEVARRILSQNAMELYRLKSH